MIHLVIAAALAAAPSSEPSFCRAMMIDPSPSQGMADAALIRAASHHDASPRSLGTALAVGGWRAIWARPDDSEPGVFFFRGRPGAERFVDVWGGPTSDRAAAMRWAVRKVGAPPALARCFADRLVTKGL